MGGSKLVMSLKRISSAYGGGDASEISAAIATSYGNGELEPLGGEDMEAPVGREVGKLDTSSGGEVERPVGGELETPGGGGIETSGENLFQLRVQGLRHNLVKNLWHQVMKSLNHQQQSV